MHLYYYNVLGCNGLNCVLTTSSNKVGYLSKEVREKISISLKDKIRYKKVYQYDLDGNFIKEWYSIREASQKLNLSESLISSASRQLRNSGGDFRWSDKYFKLLKNKFSSEKKPVIQFDLDNNFIREFESGAYAARETNSDKSTISRCCKGKLNSAGGFIWKYKMK